ncbi:MAG TPA: metallophosphoesterase family protein [candidate division Zixibacteria bacterium]|nr:metallophosphoesterase family protein [candidate division Zixibacteria bacterium]
MRIAFISDVHANLEALQATLEDIKKQKIKTIHFLGDAIGYGCEPNPCVELINKRCDVKLLGNHDFAGLGLEDVERFNEVARRSLQWSQGELTERARTMLSNFTLEEVRGDFHMVHASPRAPELWEYVLTSQDAAAQFECFDTQVALVGHSHVPMLFALREDGMLSQRSVSETELDPDTRYIINVGSVGQPRDHDPRACYVTIDTETSIVRYHRVEYDIKKTVSQIERFGLPQALGERLLVGR